MAKRKKEYKDDPGNTIVDMNVEGMPGYMKPEHIKNRKEVNQLNLTKKERRAIVRGSFLAMLPMMLIILFGFGLTILLIYFWLS